jgi:AcrR family transcriptional regulator
VLYQFFANKEAVLQALARRYLEKMEQLNAEVFTPDAV